MSTATSSPSFHPARNFMVKGIEMAARTLVRICPTRGRSRRQPDPPLHLVTLLTGQPKLMSRMSNPKSWQMRAALAMTAGSAPKSCAEMGCSSGAKARYFRVLVGFFLPAEALTPCELVNSVMIRPHPPRLRIKRRNTVSVTPAIGARTVAGAMRIPPTASDNGKASIMFGCLILAGWKRKLLQARQNTRDIPMKIVQAAVLVLVGALGAILYVKVKSGPEPAATS